MANYIGVVLTKNGHFCAAPAWTVHEGDYVCLPDALSRERRIYEVAAVVTDEPDGDFVKMIEKYIGYELPRVTEKYLQSEVLWDEKSIFRE